jgi:excisionase family DNA binding protein
MPRKKEEVPDMLTIPQAAKVLGITRQSVWQAIQKGRIKALRFGHVSLVPRSALEEYETTKSKGGRPKKKTS